MKVLLAVSGGIDSMCMAQKYLHHELQCDHFAVAHCNFHLRGAESDRDEAFVKAWCNDNGIPIFTTDFGTSGYAEEVGISIEMAARDLRYGWFARLASEKGFDEVAVAHNANDNAETLILNLLRGTGVKGMSGMKASHRAVFGGIPVIITRPLLGLSRADIRSYMEKGGYTWVEDSTNSEDEVKRNIIRNDVFPLFERINPSFIGALGRDISAAAQVGAIADDYFDLACREVIPVSDTPSTFTRIMTGPLMALKHWRYVLYRLLETSNISAGAFVQLSSLLENAAEAGDPARSLMRICRPTATGKFFITPTHRIDIQRSCIVIRSLGSIAPIPEDGCIIVRGPGEYRLGGIRFKVGLSEIEALHSSAGTVNQVHTAADGPAPTFAQPEGTMIADFEALPFPFIVRRWRSGDWMIPLGMTGRKKLSDMFVDLKFDSIRKESALIAVVPSWNTDTSPSSCHVAALVGYRIDKALKVSPKTKRFVKVSVDLTH